ncbi:cleaved adhesin domain-containing protein [Thermoplasmatales archaeon SCGC AB-540-F20]|nr:cleaved adhesin domain-containing protein [Thermoplasmatales archaeon SCGC AB-540-F20]
MLTSIPMALSDVEISNRKTTSFKKLSSTDVEILFEDGFENYEDFILNFPPWFQIDVDGDHTIGLGACDFPNENYVGSFIIFNPLMTVPPLLDAPPHSGSKFAACFTATQSGQNDDWLITPQLNSDEFDEVSFWARSYSDYGNLDRFQVLVSTTGKNATDFTYYL